MMQLYLRCTSSARPSSPSILFLVCTSHRPLFCLLPLLFLFLVSIVVKVLDRHFYCEIFVHIQSLFLQFVMLILTAKLESLRPDRHERSNLVNVRLNHCVGIVYLLLIVFVVLVLCC